MLSEKQVIEIRKHLEKAQNPVFFFDNDVDGLCSFLLLQRYICRGKGVAIKTFPEMTKDYFRKITELEADYIFILDKPRVSEEFFKEVESYNIPVVWIDHHKVQDKIPDFVNYYNPILNKNKTNEPVTFLCYQVSGKKEDLWLAVIGCITDKYLPYYYNDFKEKYPELSIDAEDAYDVRYKSQFGVVGRILDFALKDKTTNVVIMLKFLMKAKSPYDVLEENKNNYLMHKRFNELNKKYKKVFNNALKVGKSLENVLFFKYGGQTKFTQNLSDELMYYFPDKIIVVIFVDQSKATMSIRGKNVLSKVSGIIKKFKDATCGGHENSIGAKIKSEDLEKFNKEIGRIFRF
jgi:oligoribonuclease NrnB/cAMP/cGMP phosphodiesterase (DHH superfamily)